MNPKIIFRAGVVQHGVPCRICRRTVTRLVLVSRPDLFAKGADYTLVLACEECARGLSRS